MDKNDELRERVIKLRDAGATYSQIADQLDISATRVGWLLFPQRHEEAKARARVRQRERNKMMKRTAPLPFSDVAMKRNADIEARLAEIPDDTRSKTGRLMGDPLPGRRAIDQSRAP